MITFIINLVSGISQAIGGIFKFKASAEIQRELAEKRQAEIENEKEESSNEIRRTVYDGTDDEINALVNRLILGMSIAISSLFLIGCLTAPKPKICYVPTDRRIESCTNSIGIACKAVPDAVMVEMLGKLQELQDLKTQQQVDKRLEK